MARNRSQTLTDGELRIMDVIWKLEEASVKDVTSELNKTEAVAYNTVQTMMGILRDKGLPVPPQGGTCLHLHTADQPPGRQQDGAGQHAQPLF